MKKNKIDGRKSLKELKEISEELTRKTNYRISRLGKYKHESFAYRELKNLYYGTEMFDDGKLHPPKTKEELVDYIYFLNQFLSAKSSTKKGIDRINASRRKALRKKYPGRFITNKEADDFLRFLGSDEIQEQKKIFDSNVVVEALSINASNGIDLLMQKYKEFKESGKSYGAWIIASEDEIKEKGFKF